MNQNIKSAIAGLPPVVQAHLLRMWRRCLVPDIYGGVLEKYLTVIEQEMGAALCARYVMGHSVPLLRRVIDLMEAAEREPSSPPRVVTPKEVAEQAPYAGSAIITIQGRRVFCLPEFTN